MLGGRVKTLHPAVHGGKFFHSFPGTVNIRFGQYQEFLLALSPQTKQTSQLNLSLPYPSLFATSTLSPKLLQNPTVHSLKQLKK